jgi:hypothetical protein
MSDNQSVHIPINGKPSITCNFGDGLVADKESVSHFTFSQYKTPEAFVHSNFFFKKPGLDLTVKKSDAKQTQYEVYDYAALHTSQTHGETLAKVRMEQLVALQKQGHGQSSSCRLTPGYKVTLTDHDSQSLNAEYLLIEVEHTGSQPQALEEKAGGSASYENQFAVIPAKTQFRPAIKTTKPVVKGLQTAIVVGPKGEEIHTDEHGKVKVQFHWDREGQRNDRSSCWLRVSQLWGGGDWGSQFILRIGDEVLVDFPPTTPITSLPLRYEYTFGGECKISLDDPAGKRTKVEFRLNTEQRNSHPDGPDVAPVAHSAYDCNPLGLGFVEEWYLKAKNFKSIPAPQIDDPKNPVRDLGKAYPPQGFGIITKSWNQRLVFAGTYDDAWLETRWPDLPENFDMAYWNGAHPDMQVPYLNGDEEIVLSNLTPGGTLNFRLPGLKPIVKIVCAHGRSLSVSANLDTVILEPDSMRIALVWRAVVATQLADLVLEISAG